MEHTAIPVIDRANATDLQPSTPAFAGMPPHPAGEAPLPMPPGAGGDAMPELSPQQAALHAREEEILKPKRRVWVSYVGENAKGKQRFGRMYLDGMIDIRSLREAMQIESLIGERKDLREVQILSWKTLEA